MARFSLFLPLILSFAFALFASQACLAAPAEASIGITRDQDIVRQAFRNATGTGPHLAKLQSDWFAVINTQQNPKYSPPALFSVAHARIALALSRIVTTSTKHDFEIRHEVEAEAILYDLDVDGYSKFAEALTANEVQETVRSKDKDGLAKDIVLQTTALKVLWTNAWIAFSSELAQKNAQGTFTSAYWSIHDYLDEIIGAYSS